MLSQLLGLGPRRLFAIGLTLGGALLAVLLIVLWQLGVFDSPPPPAALQSAVESVRDEEQQSGQARSQTQPQQEAQTPADDAGAEQPSAQQQTADSKQGAAGTQDEAEPAAQEQPQQSGDAYGDASPEDGDERSRQAEDQPTPQERQAQAQQQQATQDSTQDSQEQQLMTPEEPALEELAGTWTISDRGVSFVGYRIGEELANIGTATAVGRTDDIVATLEFDGAMITSVTIEADLRTLSSDQGFRDSALRTRGLESDTFPFATFVLLEAIPIDALPVGNETLDVTVNGTLDLHGVTNAVSISLQGQYVDGLVVVAGSTEIALADYDIEPPTGFRVLSIDDVGIMEFELVFEQAP